VGIVQEEDPERDLGRGLERDPAAMDQTEAKDPIVQGDQGDPTVQIVQEDQTQTQGTMGDESDSMIVQEVLQGLGPHQKTKTLAEVEKNFLTLFEEHQLEVRETLGIEEETRGTRTEMELDMGEENPPAVWE
jgi:hypothetical protein